MCISLLVSFLVFVCLSKLFNILKVYFLEFLYPWRESPFCMTLPPLLNSKTSVKFSINFPSACFQSFWWYLPNLFIFSFTTTLHGLGLLSYLCFNNSQLYLLDLKPIFTCHRKPILFSSRLFFLFDLSYSSIISIHCQNLLDSL